MSEVSLRRKEERWERGVKKEVSTGECPQSHCPCREMKDPDGYGDNPLNVGIFHGGILHCFTQVGTKDGDPILPCTLK